MTVKRNWWFVRENKVEGHDGPEDAVYVYVTQPRVTGPNKHNGTRLRRYGSKSTDSPQIGECNPVKRVAVSERTTDEKNSPAVKVIFHGKDRPVAFFRPQYECNRNDFSRQFNQAKSTTDFVTEVNKVVSNEYDFSFEDVSTGEDSTGEENRSILSSPLSLSLSLEEDETSTSDTRKPNLKSRKRKANIDCVVPNLIKKRKKEVLEDPIKIAIANCRIGLHKIHINNLEIGVNREIDEEFVNFLTKKMEDFSDESYQPYCVVVQNVTKENFKVDHANGYMYRIIGGQHNFKAATIMAERYPDNPLFKSRLCTVYAGLTMEQELFLMKQHNDVAGYIHKLTLKDKVNIARLKRKPDSSRTEWTNECRSLLCENRKYINTICTLAELPEDTYQTFGHVVQMFEEGRLKDQRLSTKDRISKPDMKVYIFADLPYLTQDTIRVQLQYLESNILTIQEFMKENSFLRNLATVQKHFIAQLGIKTWDEVIDLYPQQANREYLKRFVELNYKHGTPEVLVQACRNLKSSSSKTQEKRVTSAVCEKFIGRNSTKSHLLKITPSQLNMNVMSGIAEDFTGATLCILNLPGDWNGDDLKAFASTLRSMNLDNGLPYYTLVVLVQMEKLMEMKGTLTATAMFTRVEDVYYFRQNSKSGSSTFWPSVSGALVAFWSCTGKVSDNQANFNGEEHHNLLTVNEDKLILHENGQPVDKHQAPVQLINTFIQMFTKKDEFVLDVASSTGSTLVACLRSGQQCIATEECEEKFAAITKRCTTEENIVVEGSEDLIDGTDF